MKNLPTLLPDGTATMRIRTPTFPPTDSPTNRRKSRPAFASKTLRTDSVWRDSCPKSEADRENEEEERKKRKEEEKERKAWWKEEA